jgi:hypothetical protein
MAVFKKKKTSLTSLFLGCYKAKNASKYEGGEKAVMKIRTCPAFKRLSLSDISDPSSPMSVMDDLSHSFTSQKLRLFTLSELRVITHNFSRSNMLGEGGFGPVYKGFIDDKVKPGIEAQPVAVKALDLHGHQGHREWLVTFLSLYVCFCLHSRLFYSQGTI